MPTREELKRPRRSWLVCLQRASAKTDMKKLQTLVAQSEFAEFTAQGACQCELKWARAVKFCRVDRFLTETAGLRRGSFKLTLGDAAPAALADQKPADGNVAAPGPAVASHSVVAAPGSLVAEGLVSMPPAAASPLLMLKALLRQRSRPDIGAAADYHMERNEIGEGSFGTVYRGTRRSDGEAAAIKVLGDQDARLEIAAFNAAPQHPHLLKLLDVFVHDTHTYLVFPLASGNLHDYLVRRKPGKLEGEEVRCIALGLSLGSRHLHRHGIVHTDLKPQNILVMNAVPPPPAADDDSSWATWLAALPSSLRVCIGDLGSACPGEVCFRAPVGDDAVRMKGLRLTTLPYRAPETFCGMAGFSYPVDLWALGCIVAELLRGRPLFAVESEVALRVNVFRLFGTPEAGTLVALPNFPKRGPTFRAQEWPAEWLKDRSLELTDFVRQCLQTDPACRVTALGACDHPFFQPNRMDVCCDQLPAVHGPMSLVAGMLEPRLVSWLLADPAWAGLVEAYETKDLRVEQCLLAEETAENLKYEETGYIRDQPPTCRRFAKMAVGEPTRASRVRLFAQAFLGCNDAWLRELTSKIHSKLGGMNYMDFLGGNGTDLAEESMVDNAFAYATCQIMVPGSRRDPLHVDGGASLFHMGLGIAGSRAVECWFEGQPSQTFEQRPGSCYIANMCAVRHQVVHSLPQDHSQLYNGYLIAVMLRCDVFRHARSRKLDAKPSPPDVFDIVNSVVAAHLAGAPLVLPDFATCVSLGQRRTKRPCPAHPKVFGVAPVLKNRRLT